MPPIDDGDVGAGERVGDDVVAKACQELGGGLSPAGWPPG